MTPPDTPITTPTTTLTARTPADLVAAAAVVLGFWPSDSAVMLTFDGRHRFHARVDLPVEVDGPDAPADSDELADELADLAACLVRPAEHHGVRRVVLLLYSDDALLVDACWRELREGFGAARIEVIEALRVAGGRWFPLQAGESMVREVGVPLGDDQLTTHPFLAQAVLDGRVTHRSRDELAASLAPDPVAVAAVERALVRGSGPPVSASEQLAEGTWARAFVARHVGEASRPGDAEAARLLAAMGCLRVRDAAWSAISRDRARAAMAFFADLVRRSPDAVRAPAAALLGWSAWQAGDGATAWCAIDRCREVDPGYSLVDLLAQALERAVPPSVWDDGFDWKEGLDAG